MPIIYGIFHMHSILGFVSAPILGDRLSLYSYVCVLCVRVCVCVHMCMCACACVCQDWSWQLLDSRLVLQWLQFTSLVFRGCQIKFWLLPLISRVTSIWQPVTWRWETNFCNAIYIECTSDNVQLIVAE